MLSHRLAFTEFSPYVSHFMLLEMEVGSICANKQYITTAFFLSISAAATLDLNAGAGKVPPTFQVGNLTSRTVQVEIFDWELANFDVPVQIEHAISDRVVARQSCFPELRCNIIQYQYQYNIIIML